MIEFQDARREQGADRITPKHAKEENSNSLGELLFCVPSRECVYRPRNVAGFDKPQSQPRDEEACPVFDEDLKRRNEAKDEYLSSDPPPGTQLQHDVSISSFGILSRGIVLVGVLYCMVFPITQFP